MGFWRRAALLTAVAMARARAAGVKPKLDPLAIGFDVVGWLVTGVTATTMNVAQFFAAMWTVFACTAPAQTSPFKGSNYVNEAGVPYWYG